MSKTERQAIRRSELVSAFWKVASRGSAGVNVRAVAAEANVSPASVLYYFPSMDALATTALDGVMEEFYERRKVFTELPLSATERLVLLIQGGIPEVISDELKWVYASNASVIENPSLQPLQRSLVERQVMLYRTLIEIGHALGEFDPVHPSDQIARCIVALEDSFGYYPLIGLTPTRAVLLEHIRDYAELTLHCRLPRPEDIAIG